MDNKTHAQKSGCKFCTNDEMRVEAIEQDKIALLERHDVECL